MKNRLIFFFAFALAMVTIVNCTEQQTQSVQTSNKEVQNVREASAGQLDWCNVLIRDYIARSTDELLVLERQDTSVNFEWYLDRTDNEFGKKYMIFHLGHEVSDEGNTNVRFVTNGWLYIDSLARKLYVYDFATDTIILWK
jgi:hypothetical protein